jgi:uncharacterized protein involved in exopolysaccharide biosynthesis
VKNPLNRERNPILEPPPDPPPAPLAPTNGNGAANGFGHQLSVVEPPHSFGFEAIAMHKLLVFALAVLGVLIGAGLGYVREPVYTASATLQVGEVNPNSPGFGNYTQSATSLATGFSRAITAEPVLAQVHGKLGLAPRVAAGRLSAEPIPLSPVFRVIATGGSEAGARNLANVTAAAVVKYVSKSNSATPQSKSLLAAYRRAALDARRSGAEQKAVEADGSASRRKLLNAEAASSTAQLRLEAIDRSYIAAVTSQAPKQGLLTVLAGASTAQSDHLSKLELYALLGLLGGLLVGCAAAVWRERRLL